MAWVVSTPIAAFALACGINPDLVLSFLLLLLPLVFSLFTYASARLPKQSATSNASHRGIAGLIPEESISPEGSFVGRHDEIETLSEWVNLPSQRPIVIYGEGGVGKTRLVAEFVSRYHRGHQVAWFSASQSESPEIATSEMVSRLRKSPQLLVLDAVEYLPKESLLSMLSVAQSAAVILTSRSRLDLGDYPEIFLDALPTEEAVELLSDLGFNQADPNLAQLARSLGNNPLALRVAADLSKEGPATDLIQALKTRLYAAEDYLSPQAQNIQQNVAGPIEPFVASATEELIARLRRHPEDLHNLSPRQFEELIGQLLERMGFESYLSPHTREGRRDIFAYQRTELGTFLYLVEVKRADPERPVGVEVVRSLHGAISAARASAGLIATTSFFTRGAQEFQRHHAYQIRLKDFNDIIAWINMYKDG